MVWMVDGDRVGPVNKASSKHVFCDDVQVDISVTGDNGGEVLSSSFANFRNEEFHSIQSFARDSASPDKVRSRLGIPQGGIPSPYNHSFQSKPDEVLLFPLSSSNKDRSDTYRSK